MLGSVTGRLLAEMMMEEAPFAVSHAGHRGDGSCELFKGNHLMAITLGTFTELEDGASP
jgi:hypothetical protein